LSWEEDEDPVHKTGDFTQRAGVVDSFMRAIAQTQGGVRANWGVLDQGWLGRHSPVASTGTQGGPLTAGGEPVLEIWAPAFGIGELEPG
jgi:hypothetical protein